jgi:hypothetical protein
MEEEVRQILKRSVVSEVRLGDLATRLFANGNGVDLQLLDKPPHKPLDFAL